MDELEALRDTLETMCSAYLRLKEENDRLRELAYDMWPFVTGDLSNGAEADMEACRINGVIRELGIEVGE